MPGRQHVRGGSNKDQRMYEHIKASEAKRGQSGTAKRIAAATVNKQRRSEGRSKRKTTSH